MPLTVMLQTNQIINSTPGSGKTFGDLGTVENARSSIDVIRDSPSNLTAESGNNIGNYPH